MLDPGRTKGGEIPGKRYTPEQVINKLREAEVALAQGSTVAEASRQIGVTGQTFYRWRNEYGRLRVDQVKRLKNWSPRTPVSVGETETIYNACLEAGQHNIGFLNGTLSLQLHSDLVEKLPEIHALKSV